jgi:hypothetical protein
MAYFAQQNTSPAKTGRRLTGRARDTSLWDRDDSAATSRAPPVRQQPTSLWGSEQAGSGGGRTSRPNSAYARTSLCTCRASFSLFLVVCSLFPRCFLVVYRFSRRSLLFVVVAEVGFSRNSGGAGGFSSLFLVSCFLFLVSCFLFLSFFFFFFFFFISSDSSDSCSDSSTPLHFLLLLLSVCFFFPPASSPSCISSNSSDSVLRVLHSSSTSFRLVLRLRLLLLLSASFFCLSSVFLLSFFLFDALA